MQHFGKINWPLLIYRNYQFNGCIFSHEYSHFTLTLVKCKDFYSRFSVLRANNFPSFFPLHTLTCTKQTETLYLAVVPSLCPCSHLDSSTGSRPTYRTIFPRRYSNDFQWGFFLSNAHYLWERLDVHAEFYLRSAKRGKPDIGSFSVTQRAQQKLQTAEEQRAMESKCEIDHLNTAFFIY